MFFGIFGNWYVFLSAGIQYLYPLLLSPPCVLQFSMNKNVVFSELVEFDQ